MKAKSLLTLAFVAVGAFGLTLCASTGDKTPELKVDSSPLPQNTIRTNSYADVIEPVQKAVVSVYSTKIIREKLQIPPFFRQFYGGDIPDERESKQEGLGSGVIVTADGYILTNNHVVDDADTLKVALTDGRELEAKVIGTDPKTDVAVIKIDAKDLPFVTLADSDKIRVGDVAFAVGNPLGVGQTVTMGIISATGRKNLGLLDNVGGYEDFIQTDAAINRGNSGGALIDAEGRLIGINTAIISPSSGNIGIGFAIPVNLASSVMHSLIETGSVQRGYLGVSVSDLTSDIADALDLDKDTKGVLITNLPDNSPAEKAGLRRNDVITEIDGHKISSVQELRLIVSQKLPGSEVDVAYIRDSKERTTKVKLGNLKDDAASGNDLFQGVTVEKLSDDLRRSNGVDKDIDGLAITSVDASSPYSDRLVPGMVIVEINRTPVTSISQARGLLQSGRNLLIVYQRGFYRPVVISQK